ncbi:MAG: DUF29 domain-containing protein [Thermosynechococcaceae cyanobacterium]
MIPLPLVSSPKNLYETDFNLWILTTVQNIQRSNFQAVDWDHVAEELSSLGKQQQQELENRLIVLLEHLLKLGYWAAERDNNQRGWKGTIREQRSRIRRLLAKNPSLKPYVQEVIAECYQDARKIALDKTGLLPDQLPIQMSMTLEQVLDEDWLPQ